MNNFSLEDGQALICENGETFFIDNPINSIVASEAKVPYKLSYLDHETQRFINSVGEWRVASSNVTLSRSTLLARTRTQNLTTAAYNGIAPVSLEARVSGRGVSFVAIECGAAEQFLVQPHANVRATVWLRTTAVDSRTLTFTMEAWDATGGLVAAFTATQEVADSSWNLFSIIETLPSNVRSITLGASIAATAGTFLQDGESLVVDAPVVTNWTGYAQNPMLKLILDWIPSYVKAADDFQTGPDRPLKRFLHGATDVGGDVIQKVRDFYYRSVADGGVDGDSSSLLDPLLAEDRWLEWLGQLQGVRPHPELSSGFSSWKNLESNAPTWANWENEFPTWAILESKYPTPLDTYAVLRSQMANNDGGTLTGSLAGVRAAVQQTLSDTKFVNFVKHYQDDEWKVLIETLEEETPAESSTLVVANQVKPAGVQFYHAISKRAYDRARARPGRAWLFGRGISIETPCEGSGLFVSIVAGGNGGGSAMNQLNLPYGVAVDGPGNVYVADSGNNRVQKWAPGATTGTTVAGGNGAGSVANQLHNPTGLAIDGSGNIYIGDTYNNRVQMWASGATSGTTVAGGNGLGSAANQLDTPYGVAVDAMGNVYVTDYGNHRVQMWASGATSGTTVAGGNGAGSAANQLSSPWGVAVDGSGNVYVADYGNNRVQMWAPGATSGTTVAGGNGYGDAANQLGYPYGVALDASGNIYVADYFDRVQQWAPGSTSGVTVAGGNGSGGAANQLSGPTGVAVDGTGNVYVVDSYNYRVMRTTIF